MFCAEKNKEYLHTDFLRSYPAQLPRDKIKRLMAFKSVLDGFEGIC
jgi:hypothetical protein